MMKLKNVFITGAASGIGKATAEKLYAQGWSLGLLDQNIEQLQTITQEWDSKRVYCYHADITDVSALQAAINDFCGHFDDCLSVLINNAGILRIGRFEEVSLQDHKLTIDINVTGTINLCHMAFPYLRKSGNATVINLSSASTVYGIPEFNSYSASKSAIKAFTEALSLEWREYGIRVCDVVPPFVATNMLATQKTVPPIVSRMGVDVVAEDVAETIISQINGWLIHRPVGFKFGFTHFLTEILPTFVRRPAIQFLNRPRFKGLDPVQHWICRFIAAGPGLHRFPVPYMRSIYKTLDALLGLPEETNVQVEERKIPVTDEQQLAIRIYRPLQDPAHTSASMVFFHGGGCVIGDLDTHDNFCRQLSKSSNINVISVNYRLAPEATFPAAIVDAIQAWNWVCDHTDELQISDQNIGIGGDSAGGYISAVLGRKSLQDTLSVQVERKPDYQFIMYPVFDFRFQSEAQKLYGQGLILTSDMMNLFRNSYLNSPDEITLPQVSPLLDEDVSESPATFMVTTEFDVLRDDGLAYVKLLKDAGIKVKHIHLQDSTHGFLSMARFSKAIKQHLNSIYQELAEFIND